MYVRMYFILLKTTAVDFLPSYSVGVRLIVMHSHSSILPVEA